MDDNRFASGILWFFAALLIWSASSWSTWHFLEATSLAQGFFDGLSLIAYGAALVLLVRSWRPAS